MRILTCSNGDVAVYQKVSQKSKIPRGSLIFIFLIMGHIWVKNGT